MAREVRQFTVKCPTGYAPTAPFVEAIGMPSRIVRRISVRVPPGPRGLMGFQIAAAGVAIIPLDQAEWILADDETLTWDVDGYIQSGAWQVIMFNDGTWQHSIEVRFELDMVQSMPQAATASAPLDAGLIVPAGGSAAGTTPGATPGGTLPGPTDGGVPPQYIPPPTPAPAPSTAPGGTDGAPGQPPPGTVLTAAGTLPQCGYDAAPVFAGSSVPVPAGALGGWCLYRPGHAQTGLPIGWYMANAALPGVQPEVSVFGIAVPPFYLDGAGLPLRVDTPGITWWLARLGGVGATPWYFTYQVSAPIHGSAEDPVQRIPTPPGGSPVPVATPPVVPAFIPPPTPRPV